jgi:hypothetical protein
LRKVFASSSKPLVALETWNFDICMAWLQSNIAWAKTSKAIASVTCAFIQDVTCSCANYTFRCRGGDDK